MKGDFSRLTFDSLKQFSRVLMQQGRVQLDSDWNEQASLMLYQVRALTRALVGPFGGIGDAFKVATGTTELLDFTNGKYFVNGILAVNDGAARFTAPAEWRSKTDNTVQPQPGDYLVYLRVTERHITYLNDDSIREKALGDGIDTSSRTKVVSWISAVLVKDLTTLTGDPRTAAVTGALADLLPDIEQRPQLRASMQSSPKQSDICTVPPFAGYRGEGNQLYRVEIHDPSVKGVGATFKWSRENGSVAFSVSKVADKKVTLTHPDRDGQYGLQKGDWVEFEDDDLIASGEIHDLARVESLESDSAVLDTMPIAGFGTNPDKHPLLRRWDRAVPQTATGPHSVRGKVAITDEKKAYPLEQGIQVEFHANGHQYRRGDYWLIPARTLIGGIDWPAGQFLPAQRVELGVAPLAAINITGGILKGTPVDLRSLIVPAVVPAP